VSYNSFKLLAVQNPPLWRSGSRPQTNDEVVLWRIDINSWNDVLDHPTLAGTPLQKGICTA